MARPPDNLIGNKYGRLTATERQGSNKHGHAYWMCKCDCGKQHRATASNLKSGLVISCGCSRRIPRNKMNIKNLNKFI